VVRRVVVLLPLLIAVLTALLLPTLGASEGRGLVVVVGAGLADVERVLCGESVAHLSCVEALTPSQIELVEHAKLVIVVGSCPAIERLAASRGVKLLSIGPGSSIANVSVYRHFIEELGKTLASLDPSRATCYRHHVAEVLQELAKVSQNLRGWVGTVVTDDRFVASALKSVGIPTVLLKAPINPVTVLEARRALSSGGVAIVSGLGAASRLIESIAKSVGAPVAVLRFNESDVLSSLRNLAEALQGLAVKSGSSPPPWTPPLWFSPLIALPAALIGAAVALCVWRGLRPLPLLLLAISSASSSIPVILVSGEPLWIAVVAFSALGYSALSVLLSMRRLVFMGAAAPHTALLAALIGIVVGLLCPRAVEPAMFLVGLGLMALVIYLSRFLETDIATGVVVGVTVSLSVLLLFAVTTVIKPPYSPWTLIVGDPLAATLLDTAVMACISVGVAVYAFLGYRTHLAIAMDRDLARLSGVRVALHDVALFASLSLMAVALVKIVGALLEHVFILLPAAIAIQMCRSCRETLAAAVSISIACSLLGLYTSIALGIAPAGSIGIALAACYALSLALSRARK